jgi:RNA polymerase sigma factor (sigma-70 family)
VDGRHKGHHQSSLTELIQACSQGDVHAQRYLYDKYAPMLMMICRRYTGSNDLAEEVLSDCFIKIFKSIDHFGFQGSFEGWLKRIAIRQSIDETRKRKSFLNFEQIENFEKADAEENDHDVDYQLSMEELLLILDSLPTGYRSIFSMYAIDGMSHAEIAEMLEITVSTSKSQLFKARALLREKCLAKMKEKGYSTRRFLFA